jgi:ABC-type branched-subunit amino acid transport system substrate-binding protein
MPVTPPILKEGRLARGPYRHYPVSRAFSILVGVISIRTRTIGLIALIIVIIAAVTFGGYMVIHARTPVRIGVLLPLTGDVELREPLEWAKDNINREGGIGGRPVELVYRDTGSGDTTQMAKELLSDDSVRIVIGPPTSDDVYTLAPEFIRQQKLLISPLATSGDIIRAFGKNGYFWRTPQGDVAQVHMMISLLHDKGAERVALLSENSTYGATFYDWTGFFATEYAIDLSFIRQFDKGSSNIGVYVADALKTNPDYIIAACGPADAATIKTTIGRSGKPVKLFLADAAATPVLISSLGSAAEGVEGTSPTADPTTGFSVAYQEKFGHAPTDYAAPVYDALLLAVYTSARQEAAYFDSPADSIRHVVYGKGTRKGWDAQESHEAVIEILGGKSPAVSGASGPLIYDTEFGVDPLFTYYSHWIIENGDFRTVEILSSVKAGASGKSGESIARSRASTGLMSVAPGTMEKFVPAREKKDFQAVIAGSTRGWINYRHQADALTLYTLLRENGVADDHIILISYDDIPTLPENPLPGNIHNIPGGKNIRSGAHLDYSGPAATAATLKNVLTGTKTTSTPVVLESDAGTDVFVYIAGHGDPGGITFLGNDTFTTDDLTNVTNTMYRDHQYRQLVFMVDSCFGESISADTTAPGIFFFTSSAAGEPSFGAVYDMDIRQWLSDEFTSSVMNLVRSDPDITFRELYIASYEKVTGSHVRMMTTGNFSLDMPVREFLKP